MDHLKMLACRRRPVGEGFYANRISLDCARDRLDPGKSDVYRAAGNDCAWFIPQLLHEIPMKQLKRTAVDSEDRGGEDACGEGGRPG